MDHAAWLQQGMTGADEPAKESYRFFMRPEPKEDLGEIVTEFDEVTQQEVRWRSAKIGMVRNAPPEQKKDVRVYLDPLPHIRIEKAKPLQGWYQNSDRAQPEQRNRPRPCFTDAMLTEPYGGYCTVGCAFCYVNSGFRGYRGSGLISVPLDYGEQVGRQLDRLKTSPAGYFSSFTDPFLPLEDLYHNSQKGAEAFVSRGLPIFFLSRLAFPSWAIDLLRKSPYSYAQKSINTPDPEDWRRLSPGALSLGEHLDEIAKLRAAGIYVSIQVNPIVPGVTSHDQVEELFGLLAEAGANHVIVKFVEAGFSWAPSMIERIGKRFGKERGLAFASLFRDNIGGQRTISEEYRLEGHRRYVKRATELGLTYATCYEYAYERDPEGTILSKRGYSIGSEFLTGDQCHGQRVPMFSRESLSEPFREVEECPPSGCLTCADDNEGQPRCGSELYGAAKALRSADFKKSVWEKSDE
jgi:DNA repair photolyase